MGTPSRLAYAKVHDGEKGTTAAGFPDRAVVFWARVGTTVERVIVQRLHPPPFERVPRLARGGQSRRSESAPLVPDEPECGRAINCTLAPEWAYARPVTSNDDRATACQGRPDYYNLDRQHLTMRGTPSSETTTAEVDTPSAR